MYRIYYPAKLQSEGKTLEWNYCVLEKEDIGISVFAYGQSLVDLSGHFMRNLREKRIKEFALNYRGL